MDQAVNTNAGGVWGNQTLIVLDKIEKWCSWVGHSPTTSQSVKHRVSCDQTIPLLGNDPRERKAFVNTKSCTCMFTVDLFTKAPEWKPPTCPWGENWINEPRNICQWNINQPPRGTGSHSHCNVNETWKYDAEWKSHHAKCQAGWTASWNQDCQQNNNLRCADESESGKPSVVSDSWQPHVLYSPWDSPGQNPGVGSFSLLRGIFQYQRLNPGLLHFRWILYVLSHKGSPRILEWVAYSFARVSSRPRNWTWVSYIAGGFFTNWPIREALHADDTTLMVENEDELKILLIRVKDESEKDGLSLNIQKTKVMASILITSWQIEERKMETETDLISTSKITADGDCSQEI